MGFGPQLVDIDGDGILDIVSGDWLGQIIVFHGTLDGHFSPGKPINGHDGKPIKIDYGVSAFATDWDSDGDLDLLAGTVNATGAGNVYLLVNGGSKGKPLFGTPTRLKVGTSDIVATDGDAAPVSADWDGDGKADLILGCGNGSVIWFRNVSTKQSPRLEKMGILIDAPKEGDKRGARAKVCVTDWNHDGRLDILVGDFGAQFEKTLSEEENAWRDIAKERQQAFLTEWSRTFREYRALVRQRGSAKGQDLARQIDQSRERLVQLKHVRNRYYEEEQALKPGKQYHGRVWLYLGNAE